LRRDANSEEEKTNNAPEPTSRRPAVKHHAAHGLKSSKKIRDSRVARREFDRMLVVVGASECELSTDRELLGDACKELRESYGLTQESIAARRAFTLAEIKALERTCSSDVAKRYLYALKPR
jgi:hypothetical protein